MNATGTDADMLIQAGKDIDVDGDLTGGFSYGNGVVAGGGIFVVGNASLYGGQTAVNLMRAGGDIDIEGSLKSHVRNGAMTSEKGPPTAWWPGAISPWAAMWICTPGKRASCPKRARST